MELPIEHEERYKELKLKEFHLSLSKAERKELAALRSAKVQIEGHTVAPDLEFLQKKNEELQKLLDQTRQLQSDAEQTVEQLLTHRRLLKRANKRIRQLEEQTSDDGSLTA